MSNMKCPFCQQELDNLGYYLGGTPKLFCNNCHLFGDKKLFDEIIRTRKALEIAVDALNYLRRTNPMCYQMECIEKALDKITALEQKD